MKHGLCTDTLLVEDLVNEEIWGMKHRECTDSHAAGFIDGI
jgi:hypothetical protein